MVLFLIVFTLSMLPFITNLVRAIFPHDLILLLTLVYLAVWNTDT
jgi:uncharacterized membrane protein